MAMRGGRSVVEFICGIFHQTFPRPHISKVSRRRHVVQYSRLTSTGKVALSHCEESVYYFQFGQDKSALAARLMGTDLSCELWLTLPQPARVVPKLSLHNLAPSGVVGAGKVSESPETIQERANHSPSPILMGEGRGEGDLVFMVVQPDAL